MSGTGGMPPAMLAQLAQSYVKQLSSIAAGAGGSGDVFSPALSQAVSQGWDAYAEAAAVQ